MTRNTLPQTYIKKEGALFEGFTTLADWTTTNCSITDDTINGVHVIKMTPSTNAACDIVKTLNPSVTDLNNRDRNIQLDIYLYDEGSKYYSFFVYLTSHGTFGKYLSYNDFNNTAHTGLHLVKGWNRLIIPAEVLSLYNGELLTNTFTKLKVRFAPVTGQGTPSIGVSQMKLGTKTKPCCIFTFDRAYLTGYTEGVTYLLNKGIKSTIYVCTSLVGATGKATEAQLATAYAGGCDIAQYPLYWDTNDKQSCIDTLTEQKSWLLSKGFTRGADHVAYPSGGYTDLSMEAMAEVEMKTGRAGDGRFRPSTIPNLYRLKRHVLAYDSVTLATAKSYVDNAIKWGEPVMFTFHTLAEPPSIPASDWSINDFQALVDYVLQRKIDIKTVDEWHQGLTNPRYRSLAATRT